MRNKNKKTQAEIFDFLIVAIALTTFFLMFTYYNLNSKLTSAVKINTYTQSSSIDSKVLSLISSESFTYNKDFFDLVSYYFLLGDNNLYGNQISSLLRDRLTILFEENKWKLLVEQNKINVKVSIVVPYNFQYAYLKDLLREDLFVNIDENFKVEREFLVLAKFDPEEQDREQKNNQALERFVLITKNGYKAKILSLGDIDMLFGENDIDPTKINFFVIVYGTPGFVRVSTPISLTEYIEQNFRNIENFQKKSLANSFLEENKVIAENFYIYNNKELATITLNYSP